MRERLPIALVLVLAAVLLTSLHAVGAPLPAVTPAPSTSSPQPPAEETPITKPMIVPGVPGLYLAWGSAINALPPARQPGDPLAPGNHILGVDCISCHSPWNDTLSQPTWDVVDYWLASEARAWLVFRDREYPTYDFTAGRGTSGSIGDWGKYLTLRNPQDSLQVCAPALMKTAKAANATAVAGGGLKVTPACPDPLPTPVGTPGPNTTLFSQLFNRQARRLDPRKSLDLTVSGDWPAFGSAGRADITVSYLDIGLDAFDVVLPGANGRPARYMIQKTGSGSWQRVTWTEDLHVGNVLDGDSFIAIVNDAGGPEYLHEIYISAPIPTPTPTASATAPATATPSPTPQPTNMPTAEPSAQPVPTETATAVPPTLAPTASATPASSPTRMVVPTATPTATPTVAPTSSPAVAQTSPATVAPTSSPTSAPAVRPTATSTTRATTTATGSPPSSPTPAIPPESACAPRLLGVTPLEGPRGLVAGPNAFYVALFDSSSVAAVNPDTRARLWQRPSGPGRTNGMALQGDTLIVSNRDAGSITLHRAETGEQLAIIPVGKLPWGVSAGADRVYVANFGDNTLSVIDVSGRKQIASVTVSEMPVTSVLAEGRLYLLHLNGLITRLNPDGELLGQSAVGVGDTRGISFDPLRHRLYVGRERGVVVALSLPALIPVARYTLPGPAYAVTVNEGTGRIYAVDAQADLLYVIEPDTGEVSQIALPAQGDAQGGQGLAASGNRIAVSNYAANSVSSFYDGVCPERVTPTRANGAGTGTPTPTGTVASTATPTRTLRPTGTPSSTPRPTSTPTATIRPSATPTAVPSATPTATPSPTPVAVRAKVEIVWPHGGSGVQDAELANVTAYLLAGDGTGAARSLLDSVSCDWNPTVRLWAAQDNLPARQVGLGAKRMVTGGGRRFPAWDFNDVDVSEARDPAKRIAFFVTVDDGARPVKVQHNVWTHAADARTLFPQQDTPTYATRLRPDAVDARIEIVWPKDNLPVQEAKAANVTAYLFNAATLTGISPDTSWSPVVRLHTSVNNEPEAAPGRGAIGTRRVVTGANGVQFLAWDFNDVDVSAANDRLNRIYFWVTVDGVPTYSNVWAHGADARTLFPQPDVLNNCR